MKAAGCLSLIVYMALLMVFATILNGWALSVLWEWFVVPTFSLPSLSLVAAIGIALVVSFLAPTKSGGSKSNGDKNGDLSPTTQVVIRATAEAVIRPLVSLMFGWIIHFFM